MMPASTVAEYEDILTRLNGVPDLVDANDRADEEGRRPKQLTPPRVTLRDVPDQAAAQVVTDPMASPLLAAFHSFPAGIGEADRTRLTQAAVKAYTEHVGPIFKSLHEFLVNEVPARRAARRRASTRCRTARRCTQYNVRWHTTTQQDAEGDPRDRSGRGQAHPRRDGRGHGAHELQGQLRRVQDVPAHESAVLLQGRRLAAAGVSRHREARGSRSSRICSARCRGRRTACCRCPTPSRRRRRRRYYDPGALVGRTARDHLREHLQARLAAEVGDGGAHDARGRARPSPADRARAGAVRTCPSSARTRATPRTSRAGRSTRRASATRWASTRIRTRSSASSPTRCGAPCGSSSTPACTRWAGRASRRSTSSARTPRRPTQDITVEVDRYIVWPGQALGYKMGQLKIQGAARERRAAARREVRHPRVPRRAAAAGRAADGRAGEAGQRVDRVDAAGAVDRSPARVDHRDVHLDALLLRSRERRADGLLSLVERDVCRVCTFRGRGAASKNSGGVDIVARMSFNSTRVLVVLGAVLVWTAGCSSPSDNPGNPKVPAGAKSSGGLHAVIDTSKGALGDRVLREGAAQGRRELQAARRARLLRRPPVPSDHQELHDSGRRSQRRRHRRRERVGRRFPRRDRHELAALSARLPPRDPGHGEPRGQHQRQPVLHHASGLRAAAAVRHLRARHERPRRRSMRSPKRRRPWATTAR